MKYIIYTIVLVCCLFGQQTFASHLMGGEITWECLGSGEYRFEMKLYRDCQSSFDNLNFDQTLVVHGHSTISAITMNWLAPANNISPQCPGGPSVDCFPSNPSASDPGSVQEYVYQSDPIILTGVPPANGWAFTWDGCCRNQVYNLNGTAGYTLRAIMYGFGGQNMYPCFDSSPTFIETPASVVCAGDSIKYNHNASDKDLDSLSFEWANPLDEIGAGAFSSTNPSAVAFDNGFTYNNPLPNSSIDPFTGEMEMYTNIQEKYMAVVKVQSWKCGQLTAEVFRELQIITIACTGGNVIPEVNITDFSGIDIAYADTVNAGDTINFILYGVDAGQVVTLSATGSQFGASYANPNSGCLNPPCAILAPPPVTGSISANDSVGVYFQWITSCNHIAFEDECARSANTYTFVFTLQDDACPSNGKTTKTVSITVLAEATVRAPFPHCTQVNPITGDVTLSWDIPVDSNLTFESYHIFSASNINGPYTDIDSIYNYNQTSYTHIGANADVGPLYYYMRTRSGCLGKVMTNYSDTLQTMAISTSFNADGTIALDWNPVHDPLLGSSEPSYGIWRESPLGNWSFLDSTSTSSYVDTTLFCTDSVTYWVQIGDDLPCVSMSNYGGLSYNNAVPIPDFSWGAECRFDTVAFTDESIIAAGELVKWDWHFGDDSSAVAQNTQHAYQTDGTFDVKLIVTSAFGCIDSVIETITVLPLPVIVGGPDTAICVNDTVMISATGAVSYAWTPSQFINDSSIASPLVNPISSINYLVTGTDGNSCMGRDTVTVLVNGLPNPILANLGQFCIGDSVQVVVDGGDTYSWFPSTNISDTTIADPFVSPLDTATYTVIVTDTNNCVNSDSIVVFVNPLPIVDMGTSKTICFEDSVVIGGLLAPGPAGATYLWSPGFIVNPTDSTPIVFPEDTTYYIASIVDTNNCSTTDSVRVNVNPLPPAEAGLDVQICIGDSVQINATGGSDYIWNTLTNLSDSSISNPIVSPVDTVQFMVTVTDLNGCMERDSITIIVNPLPRADAGIDDEVCLYDSLQLNATGGLIYAWEPDVSFGDTAIATPFVTPFDTTEYIVWITDSNGCLLSDTVLINANPLPSVQAGFDPTICHEDTIDIGSVTTGPDGADFAWYPNLNIADSTSEIATVYPSDTLAYIVQVTDTNGCVNTDSIVVFVNPLPIVSAGPDVEICIYENIQLSATGGAVYIWNSNNSLSDSTVNNPIAAPFVTTEYIVTVTDAKGCTAIDSMVVTVHPLPQADAGLDIAICIYDSVQLTAAGGDGYAWESTAFLSDTSLNDPYAFPLVNSDFVVWVTDSNACILSDTVHVTVFNLPLVDAGLDTTICRYDSAMLGTVATGPLNAVSAWWPNVAMSDSTSTNPLTSPIDTMTYFVLVTDTNGCMQYDSTIVNVNQLPIVDAGSDVQICIYDSVQLSAVGGTSYSWNQANALSDSSIFNPFASPLDTTTYIVWITDVNQCTETDTVTVVVNPLPIIITSNDTIMCIWDTLNIGASGGVNYAWTPNVGIADSSVGNTTIYPTDTTIFIVEVVDSNGCLNYDSVYIVVNPLPVFSLGSDLQICIGDSVQIFASGGQDYSWTPGEGLNDSLVASPFAAPLDTNIYIVEVIDSNLCYNYDTITIIVNPLPIIDAGADFEICIYDSAIIGGSPTGPLGAIYTWNTISGLDDSTLANPQVGPLSDTATYSLNVVDTNGCAQRDSIHVNINPIPNVSAGIDEWLCPGFGEFLEASGAQNYVWLPDSAISNDSIFNPFVNPSDTLQYFVVGVDSNGCVSTDSMWVFVDPFVPTEAGNDTAICANDSIQLGGNPTSPVGSTYYWSPNNGMSNDTIANPMVSPSSTTTYYLFTANDTCSGMDSITVIVNPLPAADAGLNVQLCVFDSIQLSASGGIVYNWNTTLSLADSTIANPWVNPQDTSSYVVWVTDSNTCTLSDTVLVVVNPLPMVITSNDTVLCSLDTINIWASGGAFYEWENNTSIADTTNEITAVYPLIPTMYFVEITDTNGCRNTDSVLVDVHALPLVNGGNDVQICTGDSTLLIATGANIYQWTPSLYLSDTAGAQLYSSALDTITYYVLGIDTNGCKLHDTVTVIVNPLPLANAGLDAQTCFGDSTTIVATGGISYEWSPTDGLNSPLNQLTDVLTLDTTMYIVAVTDTNGCVQYDSVMVIVNPLPIADAGLDQFICLGDTTTLSASGGSTYNWSPVTSITSGNTASTEAFPSFPQAYIIEVLDTNGCVYSDTMNVHVFRINAQGDTTVCQYQTVPLWVTSNGVASAYNWLPVEWLNNGTIIDPMLTVKEAGEFHYMVEVWDTAGCYDSSFVNVLVNVSPDVNFEVSLTPKCEEIVAVFENTTLNAVAYTWSFNKNGQSSESDPTFAFAYDENFEVQLYAENEYCSDSTDLWHNINSLVDYIDVNAPKVFSPNRDGINDEFRIDVGDELIDCTSISIYNRWGMLVFQSNAGEKVWAGLNMDGSLVPAGTYFYVFSIKEIELKGSVTVQY